MSEPFGLRDEASALRVSPGNPEGLSQREALLRLARDGANELPSQTPRGLFPIIREVLREPMFFLLIAGGALYLGMGALGDAIMLLGFVFIIIGITVVQERRTERALDALRDLSSPRALVIRDGAQRRIAGRDVVVGDIVILKEGDRVPADGLLRRSTNLSVDESLLTGESMPVLKAPSSRVTRLEPPGGDGLASVFSGTLVTAGQGVCEVVGTGSRTELGRIGKALQRIEPDATPLHAETAHIVRVLAKTGLAACAVVILAYGLTRGGGWEIWRDGVLVGLTMAMALLPEEFPVVLTVFLAIGAWRIARIGVLTRRMPAIEALGAATVLCVDKTGTLTQNRMSVARLVRGASAIDPRSVDGPLSSSCAEIVAAAALASRPDPFDPMELALRDLARQIAGVQAHSSSLALVREYPMSPTRLAFTQVWEEAATGSRVAAAKGAPEAIIGLCALSVVEADRVLREVSRLAGEGLRVLAVAHAEGGRGECPTQPEALGMRYLGLVAFEDPLRTDVPAAVAECRNAGIRVVMITGDYPLTALNIARQAGLPVEGGVLTGAEIESMNDGELAERIRGVSVFARVVPEQKLRIVMAFKVAGEVVAMTGDGVNDAPALKAAHIGIAMGGRGTDVAREAASLVLIDDSFSSIVGAVRMGRRIYDNIRKATAFIIAAHVPIAGLSIIPAFVPAWPLLLLPVHVVFLELIIDPACSLVFEAEGPEAGVMDRPPRIRTDRLFSTRTIVISLIQGLSVLATCLAVYMLARASHPPDAARALTFSALVVSLLSVIWVNRSWQTSVFKMIEAGNTALWWIVPGSLGFLAGALFTPFGRGVFSFAPVHLGDLGPSLLAGVACTAWFEGLKRTRWWYGYGASCRKTGSA